MNMHPLASFSFDSIDAIVMSRIAESLARGEGSGTFSQEDVPFLRRRIIWELVKGRLL